MNRVKLDPFLENWKRAMGSASSALKMVRVVNGVATIMSYGLVLRSPLPHVADGFYKMVGTENRLIPITDFDCVGSTLCKPSRAGTYYGGDGSTPYFPDIEQLNPRFDTLKPFCRLDQEKVRGLVALCEHIRQAQGTVTISDSYITMTQQPQGELTLNFNFSIPNGDLYILDPEELKLALIEMLRYPEIYVSRRELEGQTPLVLGLDWARCALVGVNTQNRERKGLV